MWWNWEEAYRGIFEKSIPSFIKFKEIIKNSAAIVSKFNNTIVNFYCNLFQKPYEVFIELAGTKGNLRYISENRNTSKILFSDNDTGK